MNGTIIEENNKAVLIGVRSDASDDTEILLDELGELASSAGIEVAGKVIQSRKAPDSSTYIGRGKALEIGEFCKAGGIGMAIFDDELTPSQIKNLEDMLENVRVIDRSMLILDIFALHADSGEGKIQVELAQLQYTAPRLIGKGTQLSRQQGGNIAMRGPGESKLESDRRHLKRRMLYLRQQLAELEKNRQTMRARRDRSGIKRIAIAGYTNAGKSTLLNRLTDAGVLAEDKLFATLDPTTRKYTLPCGEDILLTDTVGFIRNLPHYLIEAFKSTLDEVKYADAVIVVIDASDPGYPAQTEVTRNLLSDLGAGDKEVIFAFNKCDKPSFDIPVLPGESSGSVVYISALTGQGIDELVSKLESVALGGKTFMKLRIPNGEQALLSEAYRIATVRETEYFDDYTEMKIIADDRARRIFGKYEIK